MKTKARFGVGKKLIAAYGIGLMLFFILAVSAYIGLRSYSSIYTRGDELARRAELISDLQLLLQKILMPANDYLITGDRKERKNFANLVTEAASLFEKVRISGRRTKEETDYTEEVEKGFVELQQKAMVILSTERPVGNKEAAVLMEEMDAFANGLEEKTEGLHNLIRAEMDNHDKRARSIDAWIYRVFVVLTVLSVSVLVMLAVIVRRRVAGPLLELTNAAAVIGEGNLDHRININTGDEIEELGMEFNKMAQSLKEKINEVKEYSERLEKANRTLDQNILQLYTLYNISKSLAASLEMEKLLNQVVEGVSQALKLHRISVMLVNEDRSEMQIVAGIGVSARAERAKVRLGEGIYGRLALTGNAEIINSLPNHEGFHPIAGLDDDATSLICAPFKGRGQVIGVINAYRLGGEVFDEASYELMVASASQIGMALENARLFEETKNLAMRDGMTSLYNYRHFSERLNEEFERAKRYGKELSLIMMDIDSFKHYNDTHGHPKGDELLRDFSGVLKRVSRDADIIARYGGEEFSVILTETGKDRALDAAERIRRAVEATDFEGGSTQPGGRVTVSIGVASYVEGMKSADNLVKNADNALYRAKEQGKNRVCTA